LNNIMLKLFAVSSVLVVLALNNVKADDCVCTPSNRNDEPEVAEIVGGKKAKKGEFPWQVGLKSPWSKTPWCGGTLISDEWVLTAAHCTQGSASDMEIMIGGHNWKKNKPKAQFRDVDEIINHKDYNPNTLNNDIALIKLKKPVTCKAKKIEVACITTNEPSEGDVCTVSGWGTLKSQGKQPKSLMKVDVPIVSRSQCNQWYYNSDDITENMICAGYKKGKKDSCQGDSGGPLVKKGTNELVGVVSWGIGCAGKKKPGVYTNVANYYNWINQNCDNCLGGAV